MSLELNSALNIVLELKLIRANRNSIQSRLKKGFVGLGSSSSDRTGLAMVGPTADGLGLLIGPGRALFFRND